MFCRHCGGQIPDDGHHCPYCGKATDLTPGREVRRRSGGGNTAAIVIPITLLVVVLVTVIAVLAFQLGANSSLESLFPFSIGANTETRPSQEDLETLPPLNMNNPYIAICPGRDAWIIPESGSRYLAGKDLLHLSATELMLARNEIFARYGYIFSDGELNAYFSSKNWYTPTTPAGEFDTGLLSAEALSNIDFIKIYEQRAAGATFSGSNPFTAYYDPNRPYFFPDSDRHTINDYLIYGLTKDEACLARNEIFARHGYTFSDQDLLEYFLHYDWYIPDTRPGVNENLGLNSIELDNIERLKSYQYSAADHSTSAYLHNGSGVSYTNTVTTAYYAVKTPDYWTSCVTVEPGDMDCSFRETSSIKTCGGLLVHLKLYAAYQDYSYLPEYEVVGYLTDQYGTRWHLIAQYPSDVQFDPPAMQLYQQLFSEIPGMLETITAVPGCSYTPI